MNKILLLQGPNLNLLGTREPEIYGSTRLEEVHQRLKLEAKQLKVDLLTYQSNAEHKLINKIHKAPHKGIDFILINPAAFTHTSVALRDALAGVALPFIEIHLSNIYTREPFRQHSYFSDIAVGIIAGLGTQGYSLALHAAVDYLSAIQPTPNLNQASSSDS